MSWKDWLFIPKGDRIAILFLLGCILVLFISLLIFNKDSKATRINLESCVSEEHQQWIDSISQEKINASKRNRKEFTYYNISYYDKLKEGETIDLNTADTNELKKLPHIGSVFANRIVKYRTLLGGFVSKEQLNEVWGLDTYTYSQIEPYLMLTPTYDSIYINGEVFEDLLKHPYINYKQAAIIIDLRNRKGDIKSIRRLELLDEFTQKDIERLTPYLNFRYQ